MSQENVEIVRAAFAAWNRGDLDAWLETFHPKVEWHKSGAFPGLETAYFGRDGVTNFWRQFRVGWEEIFLDVEEIIDRGEQVMVLFRFRAKGRDGIQVQRASKPSATPCGTGELCERKTSLAGTRPSKPWGCRNKTLRPTYLDPDQRPVSDQARGGSPGPRGSARMLGSTRTERSDRRERWEQTKT
jgi:ketosteroid isomerase-like protein